MAESERRYFFKVFFPEQSSDVLRIPPAFCEQIEAECGRRVSLKGPSGGIWRVDLVKDCDKIIFYGGWKEFVEDQCLNLGDFLVFRYDGDSRFKVLVFDSSACEKKRAFRVRPSVEEESHVFEESEDLKDEMSMGEEEDDENKPLVLFAKRRFDKNLKRKRGINDLMAISDPSMKKKKKKKQSQSDVDGLHLKALKSTLTQLTPSSNGLLTPKQEIESYSPSSFSMSYSGTPREMNERSMQRKTSFSFRCNTFNKRTKLKYESGQVSISKIQNSYKSSSKKSCKVMELVKFNEAPVRGGSIFRVGSYISQRRPVTEEEVEKTIQRVAEFKSEHPFAIAVMQDSYVYTSFFMCVPTWFAKEHLPKENTVLTVWDPTNKPWKITYISYNTHGALSAGWGKFSFANNLEKYDVCIFELIKPLELKVHVYRVVEETTPLIRRRLEGQTLPS